METIIINDILPILVIMVLGYICGKASYFDDDQRQGLNKVVLNIALPAALFVSIVKATREMLVADITLTLISVIGLVALFMLSFFLCRLFFKHSIQEAAVCALIAGSPTIGFLGFAVLDPIYGNNVDTNLVIAIISIVVNAITIPIGFYLINIGQAKDRKKAGLSGATSQLAAATAAAGGTATAVPADGSKPSAPVDEIETKDKNAELNVATTSNKGTRKKALKNSNAEAILNALKQPVVWAPLLAVLFVILGIRVPDELDPCFELIAKANSGVAVLAAGLALSTVKFSFSLEIWWNTFYRLLLTPAIICAVAFLCGMGGDIDKVAMLVMGCALPPAFSGIIIASRYNIYLKEGASTTAVSTVCFAATCILWIWLVPVLGGMF